VEDVAYATQAGPCGAAAEVRSGDKMRCVAALATSTVHDAMTTTTARRNTSSSAHAVANPDDFDRTVGWRRLKSPGVTVAVVAMMIAAVLQSLGTVVIGRLATN